MPISLGVRTVAWFSLEVSKRKLTLGKTAGLSDVY